jgi:hypothetical protein
VVPEARIAIRTTEIDLGRERLQVTFFGSGLWWLMISSAAEDYSILAKKANPPCIPAERRLETQGGCADDRMKRRPQ